VLQKLNTKFYSNVPAVCTLLLLGVLAGCNTTDENGAIGSATKPDQPASHNDPENPTQNTSMANVRGSLTDYCPTVTLREGTAIYRLYRNQKKRDNPDELRYQASILKVSRDCTYEQGQLRMKIGVAGRIITGPSGKAGTVKMPLRIAVKSAGELVYSKLHKLDGVIAEGSTNGQFTFVDNEVWFQAPTSRSVQVHVGFDEGP
jgi:hypothetical protein